MILFYYLLIFIFFVFYLIHIYMQVAEKSWDTAMREVLTFEDCGHSSCSGCYTVYNNLIACLKNTRQVTRPNTIQQHDTTLHYNTTQHNNTTHKNTTQHNTTRQQYSTQQQNTQ